MHRRRDQDQDPHARWSVRDRLVGLLTIGSMGDERYLARDGRVDVGGTPVCVGAGDRDLGVGAESGGLGHDRGGRSARGRFRQRRLYRGGGHRRSPGGAEVRFPETGHLRCRRRDRLVSRSVVRRRGVRLRGDPSGGVGGCRSAGGVGAAALSSGGQSAGRSPDSARAEGSLPPPAGESRRIGGGRLGRADRGRGGGRPGGVRAAHERVEGGGGNARVRPRLSQEGPAADRRRGPHFRRPGALRAGAGSGDDRHRSPSGLRGAGALRGGTDAAAREVATGGPGRLGPQRGHLYRPAHARSKDRRPGFADLPQGAGGLHRCARR